MENKMVVNLNSSENFVIGKVGLRTLRLNLIQEDNVNYFTQWIRNVYNDITNFTNNTFRYNDLYIIDKDKMIGFKEVIPEEIFRDPIDGGISIKIKYFKTIDDDNYIKSYNRSKKIKKLL